MGVSKDVFKHWKNNRFVLVDFELLDTPELVIVLTDINFWSKHIRELEEWCEFHGAKQSGMTVCFNSEAQLLLFQLKWS